MTEQRPPAVRTCGLSFAVGGVAIVQDVSLQVEAGEFVGVIGPNGAGKTTLLNLLTGLLRPVSGSVHLLGHDVSTWPPDRRVRAGLGRSFQTSSVFPALTLAENVRLAAAARGGSCLQLWKRANADRAAMATADEALDRVGLAARRSETAGELSHGDKRKLELAILLAGAPRVLLLDEPMAGVSAEDVPGLTALIGALHQEQDVAVVMVEHHIDVVLGLAQRVAVMHHGALLTCAEPAAVMADATVQNAYLGQGL